MITNISENIELIKQTSSPFVVYVTAPWCGPCKIYGPQLEKLSEKYPEIPFYKVDAATDSGNSFVAEVGIRSVPTTIIHLTDGKHITFTGANVVDKIDQELIELTSDPHDF